MSENTGDQTSTTQQLVRGVGAVLSADIAVPEHAREVRFYSRVLSTGDAPLWREEDLMNNLGMPVIGLGERVPEYADLPLQWMPHIQVADVEASVKRALELGGRALMQAGADWAVLLDLNGAAFGIIPIVPPDAIPADLTEASQRVDSVGRIGWVELTVPDASATRDFYCEVIGWTVEDVPLRDGDEVYSDFNMLGADGTPLAGICHARGANGGLPPVWMLYLTVADLGASLERVVEEGGEVIRTVAGEGKDHALAVVRDPVGVHFALVPG